MGKSFKTTWSDVESDNSEEDDDNISNCIVFQVTTMKLSDIVTTNVAMMKKDINNF